MYVSEITNINNLYKAIRNESLYDNPYTAICNLCLKEKPITKEYWYSHTLRYINSKKNWFPYKCKECERLISSTTNKRVKMATPKWANLSEIKKFYANCPEGYEVDHVIPLKGSKVSGLHVETNLQYLSVKENRKKSNSFCSQGHTDTE